MAYYYGQDLMDIQKIIGERIWDETGRKYVDEYTMEELREMVFEYVEKDVDGYFTETYNWDELFDDMDDYGEFYVVEYDEDFGRYTTKMADVEYVREWTEDKVKEVVR